MHATALLVEAAAFAAAQHKDQRRKGSHTPYINHPLSVARRLVATAEVDDPATLAAAMLHDTIEDTSATREQLAERFGEQIAAVVAEVSDDTSLPKVERKRAQIRHAAELSPRARLVKLADKLDNLTDLMTCVPPGWDLQRVQGYFVWAHAVVAGLRGTNPALEAALDQVFAGELAVPGARPVRAVPADESARATILREYLASMEQVDD